MWSMSSSSIVRPRILFENSHVIAINKHAGHSFHGGGQPYTTKGYFQCMKEILMDEHFHDARGVDLYPVHRLDSMTSGAMLIAKSKTAAREFQERFEGRTDDGIHKYYIALSDRKPRQKMGTISGDLLKSRRGSYKLSRSTSNPSITRFISQKITTAQNASIEKLEECDEEGYGATWRRLYLFLVKPVTGKTHQIRVALKSIGSPVLGDVRYSFKSEASKEERGYLHCAAIRCTIGGERVEVMCHPFDDGGYFQCSRECRSVIVDEWFSEANTAPGSLWFQDISLLSSSLKTS